MDSRGSSINPDSDKIKQTAPSRQAQQKGERIPAKYTDPLHAYIQNLLKDPSLEESVRNEKEKEYSEYLELHKYSHVGESKKKKKEIHLFQKLALYGPGEFNELLRIAGLSFKDYFEKIRKPSLQQSEPDQSLPEFPALSDDEKWLRDICDRMDQDTLNKVRTIAVEMSPAFWTSQEYESMPPTMRFISLMGRQVPWSERKGKLSPALATKTIMKALSDRHFSTTVTMEDLLVVSNGLHVPIHWLMMGDDSVSATAKNPCTERVLTAYGFMADDTRHAFLKVVRYIDVMQSMWVGGEAIE
ncbi:hypothetical protein [Flavonifractor sp. An306]|uniref:hypothetical protein n=1 Tax=Flavonifractor sp. An306 TaxID=1965629 RepID=UPI0017496906|nr:hypothetical protein [Flavonifractor sp. An306]